MPLVHDRLESGSGLGLVGGNGLGGISIGRDLVGAVSDLGVDRGDIVLVGLVGHLLLDESLPGIVGALDDLEGVGLVLGLTVEGELVLRLAIGDLVDAEPLLGGLEEPRHLLLHILYVIQLSGERVGNIDGNDLPVCLPLIKQGQASEHLDLPHLTGLVNGVSDLTHINWVIITVGLGVRISVGGVFPGLVRRKEGEKVYKIILKKD